MAQEVSRVAPTGPEVNITELVDQQGKNSFRTLVFLLCLLVTFIDGSEAPLTAMASTMMSRSLHLQMGSFGLVFGIGQAGLMIGAMFFGTLADKLGRKWLIVVSVLLFGFFTLLTAWVTSYNQLLLIRFMTGLGMGGATPNVVALISEYSPKRIRAALVSAMWAGWPLGGAVASLNSAWLINKYSWHMSYYVGGTIPLVLMFVLIAALPESAAFMVARGYNSARIAKTVAKFSPVPLRDPENTRFVINERKLSGISIKHLFIGGWAWRTILMWIPFFCTFLTLIFVTSWTPTALKAHGFTVAYMGTALAASYFGSIVGTTAVGRVMDKLGVYKVMIFVLLANLVALSALSFSLNNFRSVFVLVMLQGIFGGAGQAGVIALVAVIYPTAVRSTALGWAMGLGRLGSAVGPTLGGMLLALHWNVDHIFFLLAIPPLIAAVGVLVLKALGPARGADSFGEVPAAPVARSTTH